MRSRLFILLLPLLLCAAQLRADTILLTTGEKLTGTIKSETDTEVTIEIPVSASITDERTVEKSDIARMEKEQPDQLAYQQLIQTQPDPQSSYASEDYDKILAPLNAFETTYPNSPYLPEIKKLADAFQAEKQHVDAGQYKYLGRWISRDEAERRRIQILGMQFYATMERQAAAGDLVGAMQTFSTIERDYGVTRAFPQAVTLAQAVLERLKPDLAARMAAVTAEQAQLLQTIAATSEPEKSNIVRQAKLEQDQDAAAVAAAVRSGAKWVPLIPRSLVSIQTLQRVAGSEASRLGSLPVASMEESISRVDAAQAAMDSGDLNGADALLEQATGLWSQNEAARYTLAQLKAKLLAMATPTPKPVVATPTPTPRPTPVMVAVATPTPDPDANRPFYMTVPGALAIAAAVLVIGGIATVLSQRKNRQQADSE